MKPRAHAAEEVAPKARGVVAVENGGVRFAGNPRALLEFIFQLAAAPAGISDEGANAFTLLHPLLGVFAREMRGAFEEPGGRLPCEGSERKLFRTHWPSGKDRHPGQRFEFRRGQQLARVFTQRPVKDVTMRAL